MEILVLVIFFLIIFLTVKSKQKKPSYSMQKHYDKEVSITQNNTYNKQKILNKPETEVYWKIIKLIQSKKNGLKVFAQVNIGEILRHDDYKSYKAIMCKRVDFCITDKNFIPIATIEYNGSGHYNSTSNKRDKIKQNVIESAGITFITLTPDNVNSALELAFNEL